MSRHFSPVEVSKSKLKNWPGFEYYGNPGREYSNQWYRSMDNCFRSAGSVPTFANPALAASTITGITTGAYVLKWTISIGSACTKSFDDMILTASRVADATETTASYCNVNSIL